MRVDKGLDHRGVWRAIYTTIWDDPEFRKLTANEKLVFLNLRTSPLSNIAVLYPYYVETLECQTGIRRKQIQKALRALIEANWISVEDGLVWVKKGLRFDPCVVLTNEKHLIAVKNAILSLPKSQIVRDFIDFYKIEIPYPIPSRIGYDIAYGNQDKDQYKDKKKEEEEESEEKLQVKPFFPSKGEEKIKAKAMINQLAEKVDFAMEDRNKENERRALLHSQKKELGI
jgi:hypothetical protein